MGKANVAKHRTNQNRSRTASNIATTNDSQNSKPDWQSSPALVVGGSVLATILGCVTVFNEFILPTRTAKLEIDLLKHGEEIKSLQGKSQSLLSVVAARDAKIKELNTKIVELSKTKDHLSSLLEDERTGNPYFEGSPYPKGFALVKVGMPISEVERAYPKEAISTPENGGRYVSVEIINSLFDSATYYYDREKNPRITHVSFSWDFNKKIPDSYMLKKTIETFGTPGARVRNASAWNVNSRENILITDDIGYIVAGKGIIPGSWPED